MRNSELERTPREKFHDTHRLDDELRLHARAHDARGFSVAARTKTPRTTANVAELHDQEEGQTLDTTWPVGDLSIALDETGAEVVNDVHDILTGTAVGGTVETGQTCDDWTSVSMTATAQVGHSNRTGGGRPPYFNATHTVGCAPSTMNRVQGTVTQGGGRGSIYCFALEPSTGP